LKRLKNKFEKKIDLQLRKSKLIYEYEPARFAYILARHYIPDFVIVTPNGKLYIELKGYLRPEHKAKIVAVKRQHPEIDLRILFYAPNKKNIKWAEKNGIKFAFNIIPKEWLKGM
jgi:predicted nuclease of restriction endonuclease-like RecB superfamily